MLHHIVKRAEAQKSQIEALQTQLHSVLNRGIERYPGPFPTNEFPPTSSLAQPQGKLISNQQNRLPTSTPNLVWLSPPTFPATVEGWKAYKEAVNKWHRDNPSGKPQSHNPYPLTPGSTPPGSSECWRCGSTKHRSSQRYLCKEEEALPPMEFEYRRYVQTYRPRFNGSGVQPLTNWRGHGNMNGWPSCNQIAVQMMERLFSDGEPQYNNNQLDEPHDVFSPYETPHFLIDGSTDAEFMGGGSGNSSLLEAGGGFGNAQFVEAGGGFGRRDLSTNDNVISWTEQGNDRERV